MHHATTCTLIPILRDSHNSREVSSSNDLPGGGGKGVGGTSCDGR